MTFLKLLFVYYVGLDTCFFVNISHILGFFNLNILSHLNFVLKLTKIPFWSPKIGTLGQKLGILSEGTKFGASWKKSYIYRGCKGGRLAAGPEWTRLLQYPVRIPSKTVMKIKHHALVFAHGFGRDLHNLFEFSQTVKILLFRKSVVPPHYCFSY